MRSSISICLAMLAASLALCGCAGYHVGIVNARGLHTIRVPVFKNSVFVPRIEEQVSNAIIRQLQIDGSLRVVSSADAEGTLEGEIIAWDRQPLRFRPKNLLVTREYRLVIAARITLRDRDGTVLVSRKRIEGETTYFVGDDEVAAERQAFPLAADDLAKNIVEQIVEGW